LTASEYAIVQTHTSEGFNMLTSLPEARDIAHEHHERFDGSGYPNKKKGWETGLSSQIAAISDVFDAVTADRVYRQAHAVSEAYEFLAASGNQGFELQLIKDFLYNIAAYPAGTIVELNDGRVAICMDTRPGVSLLPRVRILYDQERRAINAPHEIDLSLQYTYMIKRVLEEHEVAALRDSSAS